MRFLLSVFLMSAASGEEIPSSPSATEFWEREFQASDFPVLSFDVSMTCPEPARALKKLEIIMSRSNALKTSSLAIPMARKGRSVMVVQFRAPHSAGFEKAVRKAAGLCNLEQLIVQRATDRSVHKEIEERLAAIRKETADQQSCLANMPVASALLASKEARLQSVLEDRTPELGYDLASFELISRPAKGR